MFANHMALISGVWLIAIGIVLSIKLRARVVNISTISINLFAKVFPIVIGVIAMISAFTG